MSATRQTLIVAVVTGLVANVYPVMLQRSNRARLLPLLTKLGTAAR